MWEAAGHGCSQAEGPCGAVPALSQRIPGVTGVVQGFQTIPLGFSAVLGLCSEKAMLLVLQCISIAFPGSLCAAAAVGKRGQRSLPAGWVRNHLTGKGPHPASLYKKEQP